MKNLKHRFVANVQEYDYEECRRDATFGPYRSTEHMLNDLVARGFLTSEARETLSGTEDYEYPDSYDCHYHGIHFREALVDDEGKVFVEIRYDLI